MRGRWNKPIFGENRLLRQHADASRSQGRASFFVVGAPVHPVRHERRDNLVSRLEPRDTRTCGDDLARSVRDGDVGQLQFRIVRAAAH